MTSLLADKTTFEKHYRISDLARLWGLGRETVRRLVKDDPGVVKIRMGTKEVQTISAFLEWAAHRIHALFAQGTIQESEFPALIGRHRTARP